MSDVPSNARSVAYIVWDHTDKFGKRGFPGMDILTAKTKLSERQVSRNLQTNQKAGWLDLVVSGSSMGNGRKSEYNLAYPVGYVDHKLDHQTLMSGGDDGKPEPPDTDVIDHQTLMSEPPDTDVCPTESLSNPRSDPPPLTSEDEEDDLSYLYEQEINTDAGDTETLRYVRITELLDKGFARSARTEAENQELLDAGFTYVDGPRFSINGGPTGGWTDPSPEAFARRRSLVDAHRAQRLAVRRCKWEEMQRVEAEARAERDRQFEAKRAQRQAQTEIDNLAELKSIEWVSRNWDRFEKYCATEGVNLERQLALAQRAQEKATSSPFGLFKSMVNNGVDPGSSISSWDTACASPASGHAWQE
ncbi:hypothetical protein A0W34_09355 [Rhodococcus sp. BH4]|uniref:hypothetical protein n=1 Tax=Rhodococcus sp. BH4 TaxID=1807790 RepID=UPI0009C2FEED|nr:hypothetical protein [Rhodococcus sp. BH4]ARE33520.1 hypothetical protein A0W34_09355 [Rhodococcus sp. BH4]